MNETRQSFGSFYHPAFFRMNLSTLESVQDLNTLSESVWPTYLHEYVHFLQDISTSDGLANASMAINYIRYGVQALKDGVPLPLQVPPQAIITPQQQLRAVYAGAGLSHHPQNGTITCIRLADTTVVLPTGQVPKQVVVTFASGEEYPLGSSWLSESMAYLVESLVYPSIKVPVRIAYHAAELVVQHLYPQLAQQNRENVLALCDASLLFWHPGQSFYLILKKMRKKKWLPKMPEDIYAFAQKAIRFDYHGITTVEGLLEYSAAQAIEFISSTFTADIFAGNAQWIQEVISRAVFARNRQPTFMLQLVREGPIQHSPYFKYLLNWLGSPLTTNNDDEGSLTPMSAFDNAAAVNSDLFRAMRQVLSLLVEGKVACELKSYCQRSFEEQADDNAVDSRCTIAPWQRSKDHHLCSFGAVWRMWGLTDVAPQFTSPPLGT